jgi:hypothetical protein
MLEHKVDVARLIEEYSPPSDTFDVELPGGEALKFRPLGRKSAVDAMIKEGAEWYHRLRSMDEASLEAVGMAGLVPETADEAWDAWLIHRCAVDPEISPRDACRLLKCGPLVQYIVSAVNAKSKTMEALALARLVDEAKKKPKETAPRPDGEEPS